MNAEQLQRLSLPDLLDQIITQVSRVKEYTPDGLNYSNGQTLPNGALIEIGDFTIFPRFVEPRRQVLTALTYQRIQAGLPISRAEYNELSLAMQSIAHVERPA